MCLYRPLVAVFVVLENSFLVKSGRGQTKLSFGTPSFDVWCLIPEIISTLRKIFNASFQLSPKYTNTSFEIREEVEIKSIPNS